MAPVQSAMLAIVQEPSGVVEFRPTTERIPTSQTNPGRRKALDQAVAELSWFQSKFSELNPAVLDAQIHPFQ
jgi:hypothetical protein